jgi:hypothetical protein
LPLFAISCWKRSSRIHASSSPEVTGVPFREDGD